MTRPVLLTGGTHSDPTDSALVAFLADALPNARLHIFSEAAHVPHRTHPDELAGVVKAFLDEVAANAA